VAVRFVPEKDAAPRFHGIVPGLLDAADLHHTIVFENGVDRHALD